LKAFLLAAGEGRRLRPITESIPKCLVPIQGVPLLGIWLRLLELQGVTNVLVNLHHHHDRVAAFLSSWRSSLRIDSVHEPKLLGSAGTVLTNRAFVKGEQDFLIVYADVLAAVDVQKLLAFHRQQSVPLTLAVTPTDKPREKGTVVVSPEGRVLAFEEKAAQPRSNLANAGIYAATQELFNYCPSSLPPDAVLDFGFDVLPRMVPHLAAYSTTEFVMDIGTPAAYGQAQEAWPGLPVPMPVPTVR
jgi:mannose-1-phosphate guanylyltransferase